MAHSMHPVHSPRQLLWSNKNWTATLIKQRRLKLFRHVAWADQSEDNSRASLHCDHQTRQWRTQTSEPWSALSLPTNAWSSIMAQDRGNSYAHGVSVPHDDDDDDDNSVQRSFTWLTVVPMQPCSTICSILGCGGSCLRATASSFVFFCMSSIATSIGVSTTYRVKAITMNRMQSMWTTVSSLRRILCSAMCDVRYQICRQQHLKYLPT